MQEFHTALSENGRLVIPAVIRTKLGLKPGDELIINLSAKNEIIIQDPKQSLRKLQKMFKEKGKKRLTDELIKMRKKENI